MFRLAQKIWTGTKHFGTCRRTRHNCLLDNRDDVDKEGYKILETSLIILRPHSSNRNKKHCTNRTKKIGTETKITDPVSELFLIF